MSEKMFHPKLIENNRKTFKNGLMRLVIPNDHIQYHCLTSTSKNSKHCLKSDLIKPILRWRWHCSFEDRVIKGWSMQTVSTSPLKFNYNLLTISHSDSESSCENRKQNWGKQCHLYLTCTISITPRFCLCVGMCGHSHTYAQF